MPDHQSIIHPGHASVLDLPFQATLATLCVVFGALAAFWLADNRYALLGEFERLRWHVERIVKGRK